MNADDISRRFDYHAPDDAAVIAHQGVREAAKAFAMVLTNLPTGREQSLAFTALEESTFWANAAIARGGLVAREGK